MKSYSSKQKIHANIAESVYNVKNLNELTEYLKQFEHTMNVTYVDNMIINDLYMNLPRSLISK